MSNQNPHIGSDFDDNMEPVMLPVLEDAMANMDKICQVLTKLDELLTPEEKLRLRDGFEGISYTAAMILLDAEITVENKKAAVNPEDLKASEEGQ